MQNASINGIILYERKFDIAAIFVIKKTVSMTRKTTQSHTTDQPMASRERVKEL